jgi:hypothetical protein
MNLKKIGKVFRSKFVGTGPSSYKKKNLPGRGLTTVEKQWSRRFGRQVRRNGQYVSFRLYGLTREGCKYLYWLP